MRRLTLVLVLLSGLAASQDSPSDFPVSVKLSDGSSVSGFLVAFQDRTFKLRVGRNVLEVKDNEIEEIRMIQSRPPKKAAIPLGKIAPRPPRRRELLSDALDVAKWKVDGGTKGVKLGSDVVRGDQVLEVDACPDKPANVNFYRDIELPSDARMLFVSAAYDVINLEKTPPNVTLDLRWLGEKQGIVELPSWGLREGWQRVGAEADAPAWASKARLCLAITARADEYLKVRVKNVSMKVAVGDAPPPQAAGAVDRNVSSDGSIIEIASASPAGASADGSRLAYVDSDGYLNVVEVGVWRVVCCVAVKAPVGVYDRVAPAFSPDGGRVAFSSSAGGAAILSLKDGRVEEVHEGSLGGCGVWAWTSRGALVACARTQLLICDFKSPVTWKRRHVRDLVAARSETLAVAIEGNSDTGSLTLLDTETWERLDGSDKATFSRCDIRRDGTLVVGLDRDQVAIYQVRAQRETTRREWATLKLDGTLKVGIPMASVALSPKGSLVAVADGNGLVEAWSIADKKRVFQQRVGGAVLELAFVSEEGPLVASLDGQILVLPLKESR